ncbi:PHP domain-containing protein [Chloroflexota bacterium]
MSGGGIAISRVDLHIHSTASDGLLSPAEVVRKAAQLGLTFIAITDHDSINGIVPALEAAKAFLQLTVIAGVEVSTVIPKGEVHVLGYYLDYTSLELLTTLEKMRSSRRGRAQGMVAKLRGLGIRIEWQRVQEIAGSSSMGRPHIAQAMLEKGYIASIKEAFTKYISRDGPAYVEREKMSPAEAVELILRANGLPVLAHPFTIDDSESMIVELKTAGLVGIEAYYNSYTPEEVSKLVNLAKRHGLIASGGSDYHGLDDRNETMIGGANVPTESVEQLIALTEQRAIK